MDRLGRGRSSIRKRSRRKWKPRGELRSASESVAAGGDGAAVQPDEPADEREPKAEPSLGAIERSIHLGEGLEQQGNQLRRYPAAVVDHAELRDPLLKPGAQLDASMPPRGE